MKRALLACALACCAAQAQAQTFIGPITITDLSLANSPFAGGAAAYSWTVPEELNGGKLTGYILHVQDAAVVEWPTDKEFVNVLPAGVDIAGITVKTRSFGNALGLDASSLTLRGLQGGVTYKMRIRGDEDEAGIGDWSDEGEIAIPAAPAAPTALRSNNTIALGWAAVTGATGYRVRWASSGQNWINPNGASGEDAGGISHQITNLERDQQYNIQIAAVTRAGPGAWSASFDQRGKTLSSDATLSELLFTDADGADLNITTTPPFAPGDAESRRYSTIVRATANIKLRLTTSHASPQSISVSMVYNNSRSVQTLAPSAVLRGGLSPVIPLLPGDVNSAIITIVVTAEDGASTLTYTLIVRFESNDATLSGLAVEGSRVERFAGGVTSLRTVTFPVLPAFVPADPGKLIYRAEVPNAQTAVVIFAIQNAQVINTAITATVDQAPVSLSRAASVLWRSVAIPLTAGMPREAVLTVTAQAGNTLTYALTIVRLTAGSADSSLSALQVTHSGGAAALRKIGGAGDAGFAPAQLDYAATFESSIDRITITPTAGNATATITIGKRGEPADTIAMGEASMQALEYGENTLDIIVTAENGAQRIYTLIITRTPRSSDSTLQDLELSAGALEPPFAPGIRTYDVTIQAFRAGTTLTATVNHPLATLRFEGAPATSGQATASQPLASGSVTTFTFEVTAEDQTTTTYVVRVRRPRRLASLDADLSALTTSPGTLSTNFAAKTFAYDVAVGNTDESITVTPTVKDTGLAAVTVDGVDVPSGQASDAIPLAEQAGVALDIAVVVTAEDRSVTQTYTLSVTRARSSDNTLSGLTLTDDAGMMLTDDAGMALENGGLDAPFAAETLAYTVMVEHAVTAVTITPAVNQPDASVTVGGSAADVAQALSVGPNAILIVVTAQDRTTKTYTLTVTRAKSPDATLSALEISDGTLAPNFAPKDVSYTAAVPNDTAGITITPTATHADARITVATVAVASGAASVNQPLTAGAATAIEIVVTAADETATKTYALSVTRAQAVASSDAALSGLSIALPDMSAGTLSPDFSAGEFTYTAAIENRWESITVTPVLNDANAMVTVDGQASSSGGEASEAIELTANLPKTILVIVTAQDATTKTTYTLIASRAAGAPKSPRNLMVAAGATRLRLTWEPPTDDNGAVVTAYKVRWKTRADSDYNTPVDVSGTEFSIRNLAPGEFDVQVAAVNEHGTGNYKNARGVVSVNTFDLDVDKFGGVTAADGIMLARYLLGVRGLELVDGQSAANAENAALVEANIQLGLNANVLDLDDDGNANHTDGILLARAMLGLRGDALTGGLGLDDAAKALVAESLATLGL
ncbi:MAG: cadherin-like beta sandwich domain-containing protein [Gammaproteobacteria bacterium]